MYEFPRTHLGNLSVAAIADCCLRSYLCKRASKNGEQSSAAEKFYFQNSRGYGERKGLTSPERQNCRLIDVHQQEISKEPMTLEKKVSFKNLSSPGHVKAFYNSTSHVGTFLVPLPFPLSPMLQLQRGQKQQLWSQEGGEQETEKESPGSLHP